MRAIATPRFFAFQPLYPGLVDRVVDVAPLLPDGTLGEPRPVTYTGLDVEPLAHRFLADVDRFLAAGHDDPAAAQVRATRDLLAERIAEGLAPLFDDEGGGLAAARAAARTALLASLAEGYATTVVVHAGPAAEGAAAATSAPVTVADAATRATANVAVAGLGDVTVPVPLRAQPLAPAVLSTAATPTYDSDPPVLEEAGRWSYAVTYSAEHAAQDDAVLTVLFGRVPDPRPAPDLATALVRHLAAAGALWDLLTGARDPLGATPQEWRAAAAATFARLAADVAAAWRAGGSPAVPELPTRPVLRVRVADSGVTVAADDGWPGPGALWPEVACRPPDADAVPLAGHEPAGGRRLYSYPTGFVRPAGSAFTLTWPGLAVTDHDAARVSVSVERNAALLGPDGPATTPERLLRSAAVSGEVARPLLVTTAPFDISQYGLTPAAAVATAIERLLDGATDVPLDVTAEIVLEARGGMPVTLPLLAGARLSQPSLGAELATVAERFLEARPLAPGERSWLRVWLTAGARPDADEPGRPLLKAGVEYPLGAAT